MSESEVVGAGGVGVDARAGGWLVPRGDSHTAELGRVGLAGGVGEAALLRGADPGKTSGRDASS